MIATMIRDFFEGLGRGLSLFLTERNDHVSKAIQPRVDHHAKR